MKLFHILIPIDNFEISKCFSNGLAQVGRPAPELRRPFLNPQHIASCCLVISQRPDLCRLSDWHANTPLTDNLSQQKGDAAGNEMCNLPEILV